MDLDLDLADIIGDSQDKVALDSMHLVKVFCEKPEQEVLHRPLNPIAILHKTGPDDSVKERRMSLEVATASAGEREPHRVFPWRAGVAPSSSTGISTEDSAPLLATTSSMEGAKVPDEIAPEGAAAAPEQAPETTAAAALGRKLGEAAQRAEAEAEHQHGNKKFSSSTQGAVLRPWHKNSRSRSLPRNVIDGAAALTLPIASKTKGGRGREEDTTRHAGGPRAKRVSPETSDAAGVSSRQSAVHVPAPKRILKRGAWADVDTNNLSTTTAEHEHLDCWSTVTADHFGYPPSPTHQEDGNELAARAIRDILNVPNGPGKNFARPNFSSPPEDKPPRIPEEPAPAISPATEEVFSVSSTALQQPPQQHPQLISSPELEINSSTPTPASTPAATPMAGGAFRPSNTPTAYYWGSTTVGSTPTSAGVGLRPGSRCRDTSPATRDLWRGKRQEEQALTAGTPVTLTLCEGEEMRPGAKFMGPVGPPVGAAAAAAEQQKASGKTTSRSKKKAKPAAPDSVAPATPPPVCRTLSATITEVLPTGHFKVAVVVPSNSGGDAEDHVLRQLTVTVHRDRVKRSDRRGKRIKEQLYTRLRQAFRILGGAVALAKKGERTWESWCRRCDMPHVTTESRLPDEDPQDPNEFLPEVCGHCGYGSFDVGTDGQPAADVAHQFFKAEVESLPRRVRYKGGVPADTELLQAALQQLQKDVKPGELDLDVLRYLRLRYGESLRQANASGSLGGDHAEEEKARTILGVKRDLLSSYISVMFEQGPFFHRVREDEQKNRINALLDGQSMAFVDTPPFNYVNVGC